MSQSQWDQGELAYAVVTPYSLHKSRTGGILARLLWANVKLVAARIYAPHPESGFIEEYCDAIYDPAQRDVPLRYQKLIIEYVIKNFGKPNVRGISNRLTLLVLAGPNAVRDITEAVGHIGQHVRGDNVRGTFGEFFREDSTVLEQDPAYESRRRLLSKYKALQEADHPAPENNFFEPAVLTGTTPQMVEAHLKLFRKYAYSDGGFVLGALDDIEPETAETSMVVLKPESFRHRDPMPGNLIDFFARTGMRMTAMKVLELSAEEAQEFYALKRPQFREQLKGMIAERARQIVSRARVLAGEAVARMGADPEAAFNPQNALAAVRTAEAMSDAEPQPGRMKPPAVNRLFEELGRKLTDLDPPESLYEELVEELKDLNAQAEFDELIRYMTGKDPATGQPLEEGEASQCMAILYSGHNALSVIRERLKELRRVYGQNVLQNRAHASDPEEDPLKEMTVLGMPAAPQGESKPCDVEQVVDEFYGPG